MAVKRSNKKKSFKTVSNNNLDKHKKQTNSKSDVQKLLELMTDETESPISEKPKSPVTTPEPARTLDTLLVSISDSLSTPEGTELPKSPKKPGKVLRRSVKTVSNSTTGSILVPEKDSQPPVKRYKADNTARDPSPDVQFVPRSSRRLSAKSGQNTSSQTKRSKISVKTVTKSDNAPSVPERTPKHTFKTASPVKNDQPKPKKSFKTVTKYSPKIPSEEKTVKTVSNSVIKKRSFREREAIRSGKVSVKTVSNAGNAKRAKLAEAVPEPKPTKAMETVSNATSPKQARETDIPSPVPKPKKSVKTVSNSGISKQKTGTFTPVAKPKKSVKTVSNATVSKNDISLSKAKISIKTVSNAGTSPEENLDSVFSSAETLQPIGGIFQPPKFIKFTHLMTGKDFKFNLADKITDIGRSSLELDCEQLSRKAAFIYKSDEKVFLLGNSKPGKVMIKLHDQNEFSSFSHGMKIDVTAVKNMKFMNVDGKNINFLLSYRKNPVKEKENLVENLVKNFTPEKERKDIDDLDLPPTPEGSPKPVKKKRVSVKQGTKYGSKLKSCTPIGSFTTKPTGNLEKLLQKAEQRRQEQTQGEHTISVRIFDIEGMSFQVPTAMKYEKKICKDEKATKEWSFQRTQNYIKKSRIQEGIEKIKNEKVTPNSMRTNVIFTPKSKTWTNNDAADDTIEINIQPGVFAEDRSDEFTKEGTKKIESFFKKKTEKPEIVLTPKKSPQKPLTKNSKITAYFKAK